MKVFHGVDDLRAAAGTHLGHSDWHTITQDQIDAFAAATDDHQWIHVDTEKAAAGRSGRPSPTGSSPSACCRC
jgi:acyl dehydratase